MKRGIPILRIDLGSERPAYGQIVSELRALLVAAEFEPGDRLPPVRQLAIDLGVHHNTVAESYRVLAEEGWLDLNRGRGAIVRKRPERRASAAAKQAFARRLEELAAKAIADGVPRVSIAEHLSAIAKRLSRP
ncbi:MAG: GntR family transcriptional regulator [Candidatus Acidiferrales bacterium]